MAVENKKSKRAAKSYRSSFIGRERELSDVKALLRSSQLVTVAGAGGCGKTRLATELAAGLASEFVDGLFHVELATIAAPDQIWRVTANALGLIEDARRESVLDVIQAYNALLLLDNCEHVIEACAHLVEELLGAGTGLRILSTSREPLHVDGEIVYQISSLTCPPAEIDHDLGESNILDYSAAQLFVERGATSLPEFSVHSGNAPVIANICRKLDGIPLAIELAAAQLPAMAVEQIAERLDTHLLSLKGGARTAPPKQRRLRATLDWSYELLTSAEKALLRRLSVFSGTWSLEAAEHICTGSDYIDDNIEVSDELLNLVDKSLVQVESREQSARYRLLEPIRRYALERLDSVDEQSIARQAHCDWYLRFAETAEPHTFGGADQLEWINRIDNEHNNLRAAIEWSISKGNWTTAARFIKYLWWAWQCRGRYGESAEYIERCFAGSAPAELKPHLNLAMSCCQNCLGNGVSAAAYAYESFEGFGQLGDELNRAMAMSRAGLAEFQSFPLEHAFQLLLKAVERLRHMGASWQLARALSALVILCRVKGDIDSESAYAGEAREIATSIGDVFTSSDLLVDIASIDIRKGRMGRAANTLAEARELAERIGNRLTEAWAYLRLSQLDVSNGDLRSAEDNARQYLKVLHRLGARSFRTGAFADLASLANIRGKHERSAILAGFALRALPDYSSRRKVVNEQLMPKLASQLGAETCRSLVRYGRDLSVKLAMQYAFSISSGLPKGDDPALPASDTGEKNAIHKSLNLSRRETEVLVKVAEGRTNQEIAVDLFISDHTVANHLHNIYKKIGCNNRTEASRFALSAGLVD